MARKILIKDLHKHITSEMEKKHFKRFSKTAGYVGNGIYSIPATNLYSTDTRELFLMFIACQEGIQFQNN